MKRRLRALVLATGLGALLIPLAALPAAAHGTKKQGDLVLTVGFGTEPAFAGEVNSVQLLLVHDGKPYVQSNAILLHMAEHLQDWGGETKERLERCREWLFWEANRIGFSMAHLRYGQKFDDEGAYAGTVLPWFRKRFDADIARLDEELSDGRQFLLDDTPSIADCSICGYLYWPEQARVEYPPRVQAWLDRIAALPGWRHPDHMPGADPW